MAENEQFSHLCPLLTKISTSSSAQRFRKADLETPETQGSTEEKRHTRKGSYKQKDRQIDEPKENQAEAEVWRSERKNECWSQTGRDRRLKG